ncbi:hypothetical protein CEXT_376781, partial [Caerostris extrusa]
MQAMIIINIPQSLALKLCMCTTPNGGNSTVSIVPSPFPHKCRLQR